MKTVSAVERAAKLRLRAYLGSLLLLSGSLNIGAIKREYMGRECTVGLGEY